MLYAAWQTSQNWHTSPCKKKKKKINADQSICMSGSDNKTWPVEIRHSVRSTDKGHSSRLYEEVVSVI